MRSIKLLVALLVSFVAAGCVVSAASDAPPHANALEACQAAGSRGWGVAVEMDRVNESALALTLSGQIGTCWAIRDGAGFGSASVGSGFYAEPSPALLSFLTGQSAGQEAFWVGRYPAATHAVRVTLVDGTSQEATIANGVWLDWASSTSKPRLIEALDPSGAILAQLADPNGIDPGTNGAPPATLAVTTRESPAPPALWRVDVVNGPHGSDAIGLLRTTTGWIWAGAIR